MAVDFRYGYYYLGYYKKWGLVKMVKNLISQELASRIHDYAQNNKPVIEWGFDPNEKEFHELENVLMENFEILDKALDESMVQIRERFEGEIIAQYLESRGYTVYGNCEKFEDFPNQVKTELFSIVNEFMSVDLGLRKNNE